MNDKQITKKTNLELIEKQIIENSPSLQELNEKQLKQIAELLIIDRYKEQLRIDVDIKSINYQEQKETFLKRRNSVYTIESYKRAFQEFENYINSIGLETPLLCNYATADGFINEMKTSGKAPATVRRNAAAISSFFAFLERNTNNKISNPFRGTKELPKKKNKKDIEKEIPAGNLKLFRKEVDLIIKNERNPEFTVILYFMAFRGLRCGSFQNMSIHGNRFKTISKGKETAGNLPEICLNSLDQAGLPHNNPFINWNSNRVKQTMKNHVAKLYKKGIINYKYSAHDLRHFYALTEYTKNKDIYNLSKLLNHSSISVTELYLKGLKIIE